MTWQERLTARALPAANGCLEWTGARNSKGYGMLWADGTMRLVHRLAWLQHYGEWPTPGLVVDHICCNRACLRIEHLRLLTNGENIQRAYPRGDERTEARRARERAAQARRRARIAARGGV